MELYAAERALARLRLRYSLSCGRGFGSAPASEAVRPERYAPERGAIVNAQCPPPRTSLQQNAVVALNARAPLPGGFAFDVIGIGGDCS
jgi:hypothetical protein